jgi:hypothetical protein
MRVVLELGVHEIRELSGPSMDLDDVRPFHLAEVGAAAPFVDAQQRLKRVERAAVDVPEADRSASGAGGVGRRVGSDMRFLR